MPTIAIGAPQRSTTDGVDTVSSEIVVGRRRHNVYFRAAAGVLAAGAAPFVPIALMAAMKTGARLVVPGHVSSRLLEHIPLYQAVMSTWHSDLHPAQVVATARPPHAPVPGRGVGCFFSAGVDSFYSVISHRQEITHLVFVHGFDVALDNTPLRQVVMRGVRGAAADLGLPLLEVETDARSFLDSFGNWATQSHGLLLAAVALALSPVFYKIYIASSEPFSGLHVWGSHPLTDLLWSSDEVEIMPDGGQRHRSVKAVELAADPVAMRWLRVCWENPGNGYNCGRCGKCLRTMVVLYLGGVLRRCATLPHALDLDAIRNMRVTGEFLRHHRSMIRNAETRQETALAEALREALRRSGFDPAADERDAALGGDAADDARERLAAMERSRSWRVTAPLRAAARAVYRLRARFAARHTR